MGDVCVPLREAVAASLVSVIVTSSASAAVYLQRHVANLRLGMTLELFSAAGALVGGLIAFAIDEQVLAGLFAILMVWVAVSMARRKDAPRPAADDPAGRDAPAAQEAEPGDTLGATSAPDDVPAKRPSSRASRRAISFASSVVTGSIASTSSRAKSGGS